MMSMMTACSRHVGTTPVARLVFTTRSMGGSKHWSTTGSFSKRVGTGSSMQRLEGAALMALRRSSADISESPIWPPAGCAERTHPPRHCWSMQHTPDCGHFAVKELHKATGELFFTVMRRQDPYLLVQQVLAATVHLIRDSSGPASSQSCSAWQRQ